MNLSKFMAPEESIVIIPTNEEEEGEEAEVVQMAESDWTGPYEGKRGGTYWVHKQSKTVEYSKQNPGTSSKGDISSGDGESDFDPKDLPTAEALIDSESGLLSKEGAGQVKSTFRNMLTSTTPEETEQHKQGFLGWLGTQAKSVVSNVVKGLINIASRIANSPEVQALGKLAKGVLIHLGGIAAALGLVAASTYIPGLLPTTMPILAKIGLAIPIGLGVAHGVKGIINKTTQKAGAVLAQHAEEGEGKWITIGAKEDEDGKKKGGSHVFVKDGKIEKGASSLVGHSPSSIPKKSKDSNKSSSITIDKPKEESKIPSEIQNPSGEKKMEPIETRFEHRDPDGYTVKIDEYGHLKVGKNNQNKSYSLLEPKELTSATRKKLQNAGANPDDFMEINGEPIRKTAVPTIQKAVQAHRKLKDLSRDEESGSYGVVSAPTMTFQYENNGSLSSDSIEVPLREDSPQIFKRRFLQQWHGSNRDPQEAYAKMQELVRLQLEKLPDNPFVQSNAWVVGIHPIPDHVRSQIEKKKEARQKSEDYLNSKKKEAKDTGKPVVVDVMTKDTEKEEGLAIYHRMVNPDGSFETKFIGYGY